MLKRIRVEPTVEKVREDLEPAETAPLVDITLGSRINLVTGQRNCGKTRLLDGMWQGIVGLRRSRPLTVHYPDLHVSECEFSEDGVGAVIYMRSDGQIATARRIRDRWSYDLSSNLAYFYEAGVARMLATARASEADQRFFAMKYLLGVSAAQIGMEKKEASIVLMIDEAEAHISINGQRSWFVDMVQEAIDATPCDVQIIATTHAPMLLAGAEDGFDATKDKLFTFWRAPGKIGLRELAWAKQGTVDAWLTSTAFGLAQPRSWAGELEVWSAQDYMRRGHLEDDPVQRWLEINQDLKKALPRHDPFWAQWAAFVPPEKDD